MQFFVGPPNQQYKTKMLQWAQYFSMFAEEQQRSKFRLLRNEREILKKAIPIIALTHKIL
jgi:hypothetical protein